MSEDELVEVQLLELPPRLMVKAQERADELGREFTHVAETDEDSAPARVISLSRPSDLAPAPEILTLRRWYLTQFLDQIDGAAPVPFSRYAAPPPT